ncbi:MAG: hypothetical protein NT041_01940, partial [Candidatus Vogelbacteria bacterium]|nr:hypothetical protein [Candidatus Vogelbacteria bacterium]
MPFRGRLISQPIICKGSIVNLWVQEPAFSNTSGKVSFEGAILNPGFTGGSGRVLSVSFRAKKAGTAILSFSAGSILANDGAGTSILKTLGKTSFAIQAGKVEEKPLPVAPVPVKTPVVIPVKKEKLVATSTPVAPVANEPPELEIKELKISDHSNSTSFIIVGSSRNSVIDRYEIQLDDGSTLILPGKESPTYNTPALDQGDHLLIVNAVDLLGLRTERQITFTISPAISGSRLLKWGNSLLILLSILVPLAILLALLVLVLSSTKQNVVSLKRKLRKEVAEAEAGLHKAFDLIRDDLQNQVRLLDKAKTRRKLSTAENKLLKTLKSD